MRFVPKNGQHLTTAFVVQRTHVPSQRSASEQWTQRTRPAALCESVSAYRRPLETTSRSNWRPLDKSVNVFQLLQAPAHQKLERTDRRIRIAPQFTFGTVYA
jgi:hypothetical protein